MGKGEGWLMSWILTGCSLFCRRHSKARASTCASNTNMLKQVSSAALSILQSGKLTTSFLRWLWRKGDLMWAEWTVRLESLSLFDLCPWRRVFLLSVSGISFDSCSQWSLKWGIFSFSEFSLTEKKMSYFLVCCYFRGLVCLQVLFKCFLWKSEVHCIDAFYNQWQEASVSRNGLDLHARG